MFSHDQDGAMICAMIMLGFLGHPCENQLEATFNVYRFILKNKLVSLMIGMGIFFTSNQRKMG